MGRLSRLLFLCIFLVSMNGLSHAQSSNRFQIKRWSITSGGGNDVTTRFQLKESALGGFVLGTSSSQGFLLNGGMLITTVEDSQYVSSELPDLFRLLPNYPNPFNPTTTILFSLPKASDVKIQIINSFGRVIKTIDQGHQHAGDHRIVWDGRDDGRQSVTSGVYYYQIIADDFKAVRKMILLK